MRGLGPEPSSGLVHHLLLDAAIKAGIVIAALTVLALGMTMIWRKAGRTDDRHRGDC